MNVLVVDDNATNRLLVSMMLDVEGLHCEEVASGEEALAKVGSGQIDVVLLDISMPGMRGEEVCRTIKANPTLRQPRIIAYTAHVLPHEVDTIMAAGFDAFLNKPCSLDELLKSVQAS